MEIALTAAVAALAATTQAFTGLGFALVLGPVVFALLDPPEAIFTLSVLGVAVNALILLRRSEPRRIDREELVPILVFAVPGAAAGVVVLDALPKPALQVAVGVTVVIAVIVRLRARPDPVTGPPHAASRPALGLATGLLSTTTGVNGPPLALWFLHRGLAPQVMRDTIVAIFLVAGLLTLAAVAPLRPDLDLALLAAGLAAVVAGHALGTRAFRGLDPERYAPIVLGMVLVTGIASAIAGLV